ncbi:MAG: hypothetical protein IAB82_07185 [Bacteroidetes bacterium]|uniref:Lipoprotein n=1 Tax=Candidatus Cryptobacteroides faecavium TaxID=2840762 RepID=A0A9D9NFV3_9BACT|nr:hypothetical protein [Candidatus Cryptobacteroides faecavium]
MKTFIRTSIVLAAGVAALACSKTETSPPPATEGTIRVKAEFPDYSGPGHALKGETEVTDMQACIFEDGVMTHIFKGLEPGNGTYDLQVGRLAGTLYLLANTDGLVDLEGLKGEGITEDKWLGTAIGGKDGGPVHFFTGSVALGDRPLADIPVSLKRGIARFDLKIKTAGEASVSRIALRNAAGTAYLFPGQQTLSPADAPREDIEASFGTPVTGDRDAVMYAYEQANQGIEIHVDAVIDGRPVSLKENLEGDIERNKIYTVTVRKDKIDVSLEVSFEDWEEGSDTELVPQSEEI